MITEKSKLFRSECQEYSWNALFDDAGFYFFGLQANFKVACEGGLHFPDL